MNLEEEYLEEGAVLIKNCIHHSHFNHIDTILSKQWKKFSVDNPYSDICAEFAQTFSFPRVLTSDCLGAPNRPSPPLVICECCTTCF